MKRGVLYGGLAGATWGLVLLIPGLLPEFGPLLLSCARYGLYGLVSLLIALPVAPGLLRRLNLRDALKLVELALTGNLLYYLLLASAVQLAGVAIAALIVGVVPLTVALLGRREADALPLGRLALPLLLVRSAASPASTWKPCCSTRRRRARWRSDCWAWPAPSARCCVGPPLPPPTPATSSRAASAAASGRPCGASSPACWPPCCGWAPPYCSPTACGWRPASRAGWPSGAESGRRAARLLARQPAVERRLAAPAADPERPVDRLRDAVRAALRFPLPAARADPAGGAGHRPADRRGALGGAPPCAVGGARLAGRPARRAWQAAGLRAVCAPCRPCGAGEPGAAPVVRTDSVMPLQDDRHAPFRPSPRRRPAGLRRPGPGHQLA